MEIQRNKQSDESIIEFKETIPPLFNVTQFKIVLSIPPNTLLTLRKTLKRNNFLETKDVLLDVIDKANKILRISSPFLQKNVLEQDALPNLLEHLEMAFERGCEIRILSREIFDKRLNEIRWIIDFAKAKGYSNKIKLYNYHYETPEHRIESSTHSKMVIADTRVAYIGSAEFRRNSLACNFEIGCLIEGIAVYGLCEAFDIMVNFSKELTYVDR
jgi:phosphatidylserine/phosphatidylglycerophosphate/cardiolipin synthase-like enzyme